MEITVYTKKRCQPCKATKADLKEAGIDFNVEESTGEDAVRDKVIALGFKEFPAVVTPNGNWSGYRPDKIEELIGLLKAS